MVKYGVRPSLSMILRDNVFFSLQSIDPGQQFMWEHSTLEVNKPKNRYANVIAYDHSRLTLSPIDGVPGSDYINANYISGYRFGMSSGSFAVMISSAYLLRLCEVALRCSPLYLNTSMHLSECGFFVAVRCRDPVVPGCRKQNAYIATQGPTRDTTADFWRMVWEQRSSIVVMMTKCEERCKVGFCCFARPLLSRFFAGFGSFTHSVCTK